MSTTPPPLRTNEPDNPPTPEPTSPRGPVSSVKCEFCECVILTRTGEYVSLSDKARTLRDLKENQTKHVAKLDEEISGLRAELAAKDQELATLRGTPAPAKKVRLFL